MSTQEQHPSEEELRASYEAEIKKIKVEHVLLEQVVSLVNLGMRRTGQAPGTEDERDPAQVKLAIDAIRSLLPLLERSFPNQIPPIRDAVAQLQLAFVKLGGAQASPAATPEAVPAADAPAGAGGSSGEPQEGPAPEQPKSGEPGPAQRSGRLWVPGQ